MPDGHERNVAESGAPDPQRPTDVVGLADSALRSALEFVVGIAAAGQKLNPALACPAALKPFLKLDHLDAAALRAVRRAVVVDEAFRDRLGNVASGELVDEIGVAWLRRDEGWQDEVRRLLARARHEAAEASAESALRTSERRRRAAEQVANRAQAQLIGHHEVVGRERSGRELAEDQLANAVRQAEGLSDEIRGLRKEVERFRSESQTQSERATRAEDGVAAIAARLAEVERIRDALLAHRAPLAERSLPESPNDASTGVRPIRRNDDRRRPIPIPGGLHGDSVATAEVLLRAVDVCLLVDGYNVAKLGWPQLDLIDQRECCIALLEDVSRRFAPLIRVVFDGAAVVGAASPRRLIAVHYSPPGTSADDVIREHVRAMPARIPVVVVTNDKAIIKDVRVAGANVVSADTLLLLARRAASR